MRNDIDRRTNYEVITTALKALAWKLAIISTIGWQVGEWSYRTFGG